MANNLFLNGGGTTGNGGGVRERKGMSPFKYYEKVLQGGREKYQILCANCNFIKKVENNENMTSRYKI